MRPQIKRKTVVTNPVLAKRKRTEVQGQTSTPNPESSAEAPATIAPRRGRPVISSDVRLSEAAGNLVNVQQTSTTTRATSAAARKSALRLKPAAVARKSAPPSKTSAAARKSAPHSKTAAVARKSAPSSKETTTTRKNAAPKTTQKDVLIPTTAAARQSAPHATTTAMVHQNAPPPGTTATTRTSARAAARKSAPPSKKQEKVLLNPPETVSSAPRTDDEEDSELGNEEEEILEIEDEEDESSENETASANAISVNFNNVGSNMHSTSLHNQTQSSNDSITKLANALMQSIEKASEKNNSSVVNDSTLVNRLTSAKTLPKFSGDPLDWVRFKKDFDLSTETGGYSDSENVTRLYQALEADAKLATKALFAAGSSANAIIKALELRFGNIQKILGKLLQEIKELPSVTKNEINLIDFASRLKNSVTAIESLKQTNYLYNQDLVDLTLKKLSSSMMGNYIRFAAFESHDMPDLIKMANFLYLEAEMMIAAGVALSSLNETKNTETDKAYGKTQQKARNNQKSILVTETVNNVEKGSDEEKFRFGCARCNRKNHKLENCFEFRKIPVTERWNFVREAKVCFNCLGFKHKAKECKKDLCKQCNRRHHELLHKNLTKPNNAPNNLRTSTQSTAQIPVHTVNSQDQSNL